MSLLLGFLTFVLVMTCLFLMLLILIQLPKKEAGAGIAFGGAATDALFGAGSGNALTKMTKYIATFFVALSLVLSVLHMQAARRSSVILQQELSRQAGTPVSPVVPTAPTPGQAPLFSPTTPADQPTATAPVVNLEEQAPAPPVAPPANPQE